MKKITLYKRTKPPSEMAEADIDVTPVMNMFVILIPFLVSMAVFTHVSIIEFSVPSDSGQARQTSDAPRLKLTVLLAENFSALTLGENLLDSIPKNDAGEYQFDKLREAMKTRRDEIELPDEIVVAPRDRIPFRYVVRAMDVSRESGFTKIGITGAPDDPTLGIDR